ncbi:MAG: hypothetical protein PVSMB5_03000 [Ktedonobacteraceae bacterium]
MQPQRGTVTEHLADIIELLRIGSRTGTLAVERGEGRTAEEGFITFVAGQAVEAKVNQQHGSAAFNYLSTWQRCRFSFISQAGPAGASTGTSTGMMKSTPNIQNGPTNRFGVVSDQNGQPTPTVDQYAGVHQRGSAGPALPLRLPRGEEALHNPESIQLPRVHRRLLLLINGQRGMSELARLMARDPTEVRKLLSDLERSGLIQQ